MYIYIYATPPPIDQGYLDEFLLNSSFEYWNSSFGGGFAPARFSSCSNDSCTNSNELQEQELFMKKPSRLLRRPQLECTVLHQLLCTCLFQKQPPQPPLSALPAALWPAFTLCIFSWLKRTCTFPASRMRSISFKHRSQCSMFSCSSFYVLKFNA